MLNVKLLPPSQFCLGNLEDVKIWPWELDLIGLFPSQRVYDALFCFSKFGISWYASFNSTKPWALILNPMDSLKASKKNSTWFISHLWMKVARVFIKLRFKLCNKHLSVSKLVHFWTHLWLETNWKEFIDKQPLKILPPSNRMLSMLFPFPFNRVIQNKGFVSQKNERCSYYIIL